MAPPKLKPWQKKRIVERYLEDSTVCELATEYEVAERTIHRVIAAAGKSYSRQARPMPRMERDEVVARHEAGERTGKLAREVGVTTTTVRRYVREAKMSKNGKPKSTPVEEVGAPPLAFPEEEIRAISEALSQRVSFTATSRQRAWQSALRRVEEWEARHGRS